MQCITLGSSDDIRNKKTYMYIHIYISSQRSKYEKNLISEMTLKNVLRKKNTIKLRDGATIVAASS